MERKIETILSQILSRKYEAKVTVRIKKRGNKDVKNETRTIEKE